MPRADRRRHAAAGDELGGSDRDPIVPVAIVAGALALLVPGMLVQLLLIGYSGIAQLAPAVFLGLFTRRPTLAGVAGGLAVGLAVVAAAHLSGWAAPWGLHTGLVGLVANGAVAIVISRATRPPPAARLDRFERMLAG